MWACITKKRMRAAKEKTKDFGDAETPGWVAAACSAFMAISSKKSVIITRKTNAASCTKKSKIFLSKKRKKILRFPEECDKIDEQDCDTICDEAGGCG